MRRDVGFVLESGDARLREGPGRRGHRPDDRKGVAVENLEAALSVKGVDMVQFGPADYSMSIGLPGQFKHPKVKEAERYVIETALKMGLHPRAEIAHPDQAKEYLDMGVRHFCIGSDVTILYDWFKRNGKEMGSLVGRSPSDESIRDFRGAGEGGYRRRMR